MNQILPLNTVTAGISRSEIRLLHTMQDGLSVGRRNKEIAVSNQY